MKKTITEEMIKAYVESDGSRCPFCNSPDIEASGDFDFEGGMVFENIICLECDEEWTDEYTLSGFSYDGIKT